MDRQLRVNALKIAAYSYAGVSPAEGNRTEVIIRRANEFYDYLEGKEAEEGQPLKPEWETLPLPFEVLPLRATQD
jgi:hypothetical protein